MLASQFLLEGSMLGSALPEAALKGSTALVVPLQLRIHFLQKKQKQSCTSLRGQTAVTHAVGAALKCTQVLQYRYQDA